MSYAMPLAFGTGYLGSGVLGDRARAGGGVAFVPAVLLGTVIGANLGPACATRRPPE